MANREPNTSQVLEKKGSQDTSKRAVSPSGQGLYGNTKVKKPEQMEEDPRNA